MQQRRIVRARDLAAFRDAVVALALEGAPLAARRRAVLVPTRASAELLRQTIESRLGVTRPAAVVLPDLLTRAEWLEHLLDAVPGGRGCSAAPSARCCSSARRARPRGARDSAARRFRCGPGSWRRCSSSTTSSVAASGPCAAWPASCSRNSKGERGTDRGSESLIHQTCFLGLSFLAYERAVAASGGLDEHVLRRALLDGQPRLPYDARRHRGGRSPVRSARPVAG